MPVRRSVASSRGVGWSQSWAVAVMGLSSNLDFEWKGQEQDKEAVPWCGCRVPRAQDQAGRDGRGGSSQLYGHRAERAYRGGDKGRSAGRVCCGGIPSRINGRS